MIVTVNSSKASGVIDAPPSKSMLHRYILCAALANGISMISNVAFSEDIMATLDCVGELGAKVKVKFENRENFEEYKSENITGNVTKAVLCIAGNGAVTDKKELSFRCNESGSTLRFLMGIAMSLNRESFFYGSETLRKRPLTVYRELCAANGIEFRELEDSIYLKGSLKSGEYTVPGDISSQFITGLLFTLPMLNGDSRISLTGTVESRSYIDLTIAALGKFGVTITWEASETLYIKGNQSFVANDIFTEGDYSNAAFLDAFNAIGGNVSVTGLDCNSLQGDRVYKECFEKLCAGKAEIDITDCPDLGPVLMAVAAAKYGARLTGTRRLKIKESDRGAAMSKELSAFGIKTIIEENSIEIEASGLRKPQCVLSGHNDHRIVMSLTLLLTLTGGEIDEAQAVRKSYPNFFEDIKKLGIIVKDDEKV